MTKHFSISQYISDPQTRSLGILFALNAILFSNWAVRIPDVKLALNLSDADLGWALLASPLGVVVCTPFVGYFIHKFGPGIVSVISAVFFCISIFCLAFPISFTQLIFALFFLGIANGSMDISMNALASALEKAKDKIFMSKTHGFWSLTAMIASLIAGFIASREIEYGLHFQMAAVLVVILLFICVRNIRQVRDSDESKIQWQWPGVTVFLLIIISFIVFLVEGGIMDWNSLFYKEVLGSPVAMMSFGFAAFSLAMAIARFYGDNLFSKFSSKRIIFAGCLIVSLGLFLFSLGNSLLVSTISMIITGLGCSVLIPILFREAGRLPDVPPSLGIASVSTFGYTGFLAGPPIIGFISEAHGLQISFACLAAFMLTAVIISLLLKI